ncbi:GTPase-activating protein S23 [Globomyces sp. JEL0801]|nr:GTPase-activating protein S23 [Globomyces sp. JEL0801]
MASFEEIEDNTGVRLSWNAWPTSRIEATRLVVPISAMYTPLKERDHRPFQYEPIACKSCRGILNPCCQLDFRGKIWTCALCFTRNQLPPHYSDISPTQMPPELMQEYLSIEYILNKPPSNPPIFVFVVDTCLREEDLKSLKDSLIVSLSLLPQNALVGLVTFGTMAQVHEIGFSECPKSYVFRGSKDYTGKQIQEMLGLAGQQRSQQPVRPGQPLPPSAPGFTRFLQPVAECEFNLTTILEQLPLDPWPVPSDKRPFRCTGTALAVTIGLIEAAYQNAGARVLLFAGGAATEGPGQIVGNELREALRSHHDLEKDTAKHCKKATKFYDALAKRCTEKGITVDIFAGCLDQIGLMEMKSLVNTTNGFIVLADSFSSSIFKQSFTRLFNKDRDGFLKLAFNATLEVQTSRELKICGLIGPAISANKKAPCVGETEIGISGTNAWKFCGITPATSCAIYFEVQSFQPGTYGVIQFTTLYQHSSGQTRLRVTTIPRVWAEPTNPCIAASFDQEAAAVLMARIGSFKSEVDDGPDVLRWLDRMLIRVCQRFGTFVKEDPNSFQLAANFSIYPQFMFHLRRSSFLQVFNCSPDETAYYRNVLMREDVNNSLIMIQPTLMSYSMEHPPQPVLLDSVSIQPNVTLLLDTYFQVLVWHGETISQWRRAKYHENPTYVAFKEMLEAPAADAIDILSERFPVPRYVDCDQGGSQARFLLAKVNPSTTHNTAAGYGGSGQAIPTDDVSLQVFMEHLKKLSVATS